MAPFYLNNPLDLDDSDVATIAVEGAVEAESSMQPLNEDSAAAVLQLADARFGMASALLKLAEKARREAAEGLIVDKLEEEFEKEMVGIEKLTAHGLVGVDLWLDGRVQ
eukprot:10372-Heterococcus_DN1.PRE.1